MRGCVIILYSEWYLVSVGVQAGLQTIIPITISQVERPSQTPPLTAQSYPGTVTITAHHLSSPQDAAGPQIFPE